MHQAMHCLCWYDDRVQRNVGGFWQDTDKKVVALRDFNSKLLSDERITLSIVPVGDGIALCRRRK